MTSNEIWYAKHLVDKENWGLVQIELEDLLEFSPNSIFVGQEQNSFIGTIFAIEYDQFIFFGNIIVAKEHRGQGYGKELINFTIKKLEPQNKPILLDAVESVVPLYEKFNFKPICKSLRFRSSIAIPEEYYREKHLSITKMTKNDLDTVFALDKKHFGASRERLILKLFKREPELCLISKRDDKITGYIMALRRNDYLKVGPWIVDGENNYEEEFLYELSIVADQKEMYLGVLESNEKAVQAIKLAGLKQISYSIRMVRGVTPNYSGGIFAVAGPDRG